MNSGANSKPRASAHAGGAIAAGHPLTAEAAEHILRTGGNAYDAALAALMAACVTEPVLASLGGGGFLLACPESGAGGTAGAARLFDFFVATPSQRRAADELDFGPITANFGAATQEFHIGHGTIAVPGMVRGMFDIHAALGTMPMRDIAAPAISYAKDGITVTPFQAMLFEVIEAPFVATEACREIFGSADDPQSLVREGERLVQLEMADTLETLSIEGPELFYRGEIGGRLIEGMRAGGYLQRCDLEAYQTCDRAPLSLDIGTERGGVRVHTNPPPSSGGLLVAFGLKLLEGRDLSGLEFGSAEHIGLLASVIEQTGEARLVELGARDRGGDRGSDRGGEGDDPMALLDPALLQRYRDEISGRHPAMRGTTQISIIDGGGNLASMTLSNGEGSGYVIPGTGIVMNNMLGEQDLNPGGFHRWPMGARMTSMMAPTAVIRPDGRKIATGSGGSNRIRSAVLQVVFNIVHLGMALEEAVAVPRIHVEGGLLSIEAGLDAERLAPVLDQFTEHQLWEELNLFFGGAHSVEAKGSSMAAIGDPRRGGASILL